jgi:hypothetical protein
MMIAALLIIGIVITIVIILALIGRFKEGHDDVRDQQASSEGGQEDHNQERDRHDRQ